MKKKLATLFALLALSPLLTQCATQDDVSKLNYQLRVVNKKLEDMKMGTVGQMQQRQASSSSQIDELRQEILVLRGQLDEMAHYNRQLTEQNKELDLSLQQYAETMSTEIEKEIKTLQTNYQTKEAKLDDLEKSLTQQQKVLQSIQESRIQEARKKAEAAALAAEKARARAKASSQALASSNGQEVVSIDANKTKTVYGNSAERKPSPQPTVQPEKTDSPASVSPPESTPQATPDSLESADKAYADGDFVKAYDLYEKYALEHKTGDKVITAKYMMGESLFNQEEYDQAILQYQNIISNHPSHARAASALLKQGMAFEKVSDFETAKIIYKKIATAYPSSPEAERAKERSSKIN